jgi:hypothetical protein
MEWSSRERKKEMRVYEREERSQNAVLFVYTIVI